MTFRKQALNCSDYPSVQPDYDEEDGDAFLVHNGGLAKSTGIASQPSTPGYAPAGEPTTPIPDSRQWRRYPQARPGRAPTICDLCRGRSHVFRNCPTLSFIYEPIRSRIIPVREWNLESKAQPGIALSQATERMNQNIEEMLRYYVDHHQSNWDKQLIDVEIAQICSPHATTTFSPFYLNYGYEPRTIPLNATLRTDTNFPALSQWLDQLELTPDTAQKAI